MARATILIFLLAGAALLAFVHWLFGLFFIEMAALAGYIERRVGLSIAARVDTKGILCSWPPPRTVWLQGTAASVLAAAVSFVVIETGFYFGYIIIAMAFLPPYVIWWIRVTERVTAGRTD